MARETHLHVVLWDSGAHGVVKLQRQVVVGHVERHVLTAGQPVGQRIEVGAGEAEAVRVGTDAPVRLW